MSKTNHLPRDDHLAMPQANQACQDKYILEVLLLAANARTPPQWAAMKGTRTWEQAVQFYERNLDADCPTRIRSALTGEICTRPLTPRALCYGRKLLEDQVSFVSIQDTEPSIAELISGGALICTINDGYEVNHSVLVVVMTIGA